MLHAQSAAIGLTLVALAASHTLAQNQRTYTEGGVHYRETVSETQRLLPTTRYETREKVVHQPRYTTNMHESVRTYQVPVTEQQWVLGYQRTWNIFRPPVPSYRLMPVTRWETRTETVRVPITKLEYVPQRIVQQVPITDTKIARETVTRRVAIGVAKDATAVARKPAPVSSSHSEPPTATNNELDWIDSRK